MIFRKLQHLFLITVCSVASTNAFLVPGPSSSSPCSSTTRTISTLVNKQTTALFYKDDKQAVETRAKGETADEDVERLRALAAKYRAEAAALEAERSQEMAAAAERAFAKFDRNDDGKISVVELKQGLEKQFKTDLPQDRVEKLLRKFDTSGDGMLQLEEFVGAERFKAALDEFAREERRQAIQLQSIAKQEQQVYEQISQLLNDKPPTNTDKILSVLPYLFPLLDALPYASFLAIANPDNKALQFLSLVFYMYRSVPLSGFLAALSLTFLSGMPSINRLIRFNMLQAIYFDILLFIPGFISLLAAGGSALSGQQVPVEVAATVSTALFALSVSTILYATISSLAGQEPDRIPVVSETVKKLLPSVETLKQFFDEQKWNSSDKDH